MAKVSFNDRMKERFTKITNDYQKVNEYVHETAVMIMEHALKCGDCTTAQGLVMAMPASIRREMMILWFKSFSPIVVKNDDKWRAKMHKEGSKLYVPFDIEAAKATPFYTLAEKNKERAPLDFDALLKMVERLATQIEKRVENGEVAEEAIATAEDVARRLKGFKIKKIVSEASSDASNDDIGEERAAA